jgi:hypothetical protein
VCRGIGLLTAALALSGSIALAQPMRPNSPGEPDPGSANDAPLKEVQARYHDIVTRAVAEFDAGHWAESRSLFLEAHALWPNARTYRTLGMTSFELRSYARALEELDAALHDPRRPLPDDQRERVVQLMDQARAFVGRYRVHVQPQHAELLVDGAPHSMGREGMLLLEVGNHDLLVHAPGYVELRRRLEVQGREEQELTLMLEPLPPQPPASLGLPPSVRTLHEVSPPVEAHGGRTWTLIAGGTAIALGAASTALWFVSDSKFDTLKAECAKRTCTRANTDTSAVEATQTAHQVTLGLAIAAGASAVGLYFLEGREQRSPTIAVGPGALFVRGRF